MNVVSLFDGISCARVALGNRVKTYYACEIDTNAIKVAKENFPDTIHLGSVTDVSGTTIPVPIDLLIGGSPCQDLSLAKKDRKGLEGDRSKLFWEYVRIKNLLKPKWFILENVASMSVKDRETITEIMGVQPILINAALVSAQSRKRLFWTNIPNITQPADRGIVLKDILQPETEVDERFITKSNKAFCLTSSYGNASTSPKDVEHNAKKKKRTMVLSSFVKPDVTSAQTKSIYQLGYFGSENHCKRGGQNLRIYDADCKSTTSEIGLYAVCRQINRRLDSEGVRKDTDTSIPMTSCVELRTDDKSGTLTSVLKDNQVINTETNVIRRLTPIECERLQSLPDNYTRCVPTTARYKALGNAFNVEVIRHILSFLPTV